MTEIIMNRDHYIKHTEIFNWCSETFGDGYQKEHRWSVTITFGHQVYQFTDEKDATLFVLKWVR